MTLIDGEGLKAIGLIVVLVITGLVAIPVILSPRHSILDAGAE